MKKNIALVWFLTIATLGQSQTLLNELALDKPESNPPAFKAMKIVNLQSTKIADRGDWYMYVSHRFGSIQGGFDTFYGLDKANTKLEMIYGLSNRIQLGLSRESLRQTFAGSVKARVLQSLPLRLAIYSTANINSSLPDETDFQQRLSFANQLLVAKRINSKLSLEIAPTHVRFNLPVEEIQKFDQLALGLGGRYKFTKRLSINADYIYNFNRSEESSYVNPLSIGIDIDTGGHIFQLMFSNAQSANEPGFISNAEGDWSEGDIYFGFHIVRVF